MATYVTTYCNFAHDVKTGKPIGHECIIIPPKALAAEMSGDYETAIGILAEARGAGKIRTMRRGKKALGAFPDDYNIEFRVHEGQPSWHQRRAGHRSAGITTGFKTRAAAEEFAAKLRKNSGVSAWIEEVHSEKGLGDAEGRPLGLGDHRSVRDDVLSKLVRERDEWSRELRAAVAGKTRVTEGWKTEARSKIRQLGAKIRELEQASYDDVDEGFFDGLPSWIR